jgi:GAF domain-containing protein
MTADQPNQTQTLSAELDQLAQQMRSLDQLLRRYLHAAKQGSVSDSAELERTLAATHSQLRTTQQNGRKAATQLNQLEQLVHTSALITSSLDLDEVLGSVMDTVVQLTGAERAYLMLYDEHKGPEIRAARNWDRESIAGDDAQFSRSIVRAAIDQQMPVITTNAQSDDRFGTERSILIQQLRSVLAIPLTIGGHLVGILYADNRFQLGVFKPEMLPVLTAFGAQAAIAIQNARTFGTVRDNLAKAEQEITRLRVEIDRGRQSQEVKAIVESDMFASLQEKARVLRERRNRRNQ